MKRPKRTYPPRGFLYEYSKEELESQPVLERSHTDDLIQEASGWRLWLNRTSGEATVEELQRGKWTIVKQYWPKEEGADA